MTHNPKTTSSATRQGAPAGRRPKRLLAAAAAAVLLSACGGGGEPDVAEPAPDAEPTAQVQGRSFTLWRAGAETEVQAEQLALEPEGGGQQVRLVVRLNPAAVPPSDRATMVGTSGNGEAADAAALRQRELANKTAAVATATQAVMAGSVLRLAPGAAVRQQFAHALEGFVVVVPWSQAQAVADELARNPAVDAVELDRALAIGQAATTERVLDGRAWGVDRIDQRARAFDGRFRNANTGRGVNVYVVDTGVAPHAQFDTRLRSGFSAVNDGNGTRDCHGHGTHVAGTAAGASVGVAPAAQVVPVRVMDCRGSGAGSQVIAGLDWVAANGVRPGVVNMSLGGGTFTSLDAAAQRLAGVGFTVVAAAGNSNVDACTQSPARATGLVTVGATDNADAKASYSNWGACVSLWAPGSGIASASPASDTALATMSGTSMAAPHVAGAAALLLQAQPGLSAAQVLAQLKQRATPDVVLGVAAPLTRSLLFAGDTAGGAAAPVAVRASSITLSTQTPTLGTWSAQAVVLVVNDKAQPVAGAQVAGRFSNMTSEVVCTTAANGSCALTSAAAPWGTVPTLGFAVTAITGNQLAYAGAGMRNAQVAQPAAPVATVSALVGTIVRPTATSPQWTPQFTVTVLDERRNPVSGATVQGLLNIHSGARVVGQQTLSCQTGANGQCRLAWSGPTLGAAQTGAALQVTAVARPFLVYQAGALTRAVVGRVQ